MQAPGIEPGTLTTITDSHIYNFITNSPSRMRSRRYTTRSQLRRLLYTGFGFECGIYNKRFTTKKFSQKILLTFHISTGKTF